MKRERVIFIIGPTGVGKTAFAVELAKRLKGEIISADSMQAYRFMDIMSQKPTPGERKAVLHHLVDFLDIDDEYSAAEFIKRADPLIDKIIKKNKRPLVVGGSGLYIKALVDGLFPAPEKDTAFRKRLQKEARSSGTKKLHDRLKIIDPEASSKIHHNDLRRIIRALEIFHLTGTPISAHKGMTKGIKDSYAVRLYGLIMPRPMLYERIEKRADEMLEAGLVEEVKLIRRRDPSMTASSSLGYKEILGYLDKRYSLDCARELLKKNTKHLAKKQLSWFKADNRIRWIDLKEISQENAIRLIVTECKV
ncbi:MAG: tRNA (adenosine(37)-N6)-dimethylallyltransferase MiaA [Candidatus Omnitrophica bacterium]|nr:tRNA (adenosine(37)-N6)-dimethylallyltransferase MiaA [Candidatus Omnitrophota bacterium]